MRLLRILTIALVLAPSAAGADEGMWTFDRFPSAKVEATYGFRPTAEFLDHLRKSSVLVAGNCSASFVSPDGLVMTNEHCAADCIDQLSTAQKPYVTSGFYARSSKDETACPDFELDQLTQIDDVTSAIARATAGTSGEAGERALRGAEATARQTCAGDPTVRCDVVSLYHGGVYDLYRYKRYTDVRLAFAPEYGIAQFGGDPDNFTFPRYNYDVALLRAYEHGRPAATPDYLKWSPRGSKPGDLVFVSGNPAGTSRVLTVAQLDFMRDVRYPFFLPLEAEYRGILEQFARQSPTAERESRVTLQEVENDFKAQLGEQSALDDADFFASKALDERRLRETIAEIPALQTAYGSAWTDLERVQATRARLSPQYNAVNLAESPYWTTLFSDAVSIVRAATERAMPAAERLPDFSDRGLASLAQQIAAPVPVYADLEELNLTFVLTQLRRTLGTDDPLVKSYLGRESPSALAHRLVAETKLGDASVRAALLEGGRAAIDASTDPMIVLARRVEPGGRAVRSAYDAEITGPTRAATERIAKARFAAYGTNVYPDATFTLRLSYGTVKGFDANGIAVAPYTTVGGLFDRATGAAPYDLPQSWLAARSKLARATPMNVATTNDIISGNSGSPLVDTNGKIVGLIFDGNAYALAGDFGYDAVRSRSIAVDSRVLLGALDTVYHADRLVREIDAAAR